MHKPVPSYLRLRARDHTQKQRIERAQACRSQKLTRRDDLRDREVKALSPRDLQRGFAWALADPHRTARERLLGTRAAQATRTILVREHPRRESARAACELLFRARLHPKTTCEIVSGMAGFPEDLKPVARDFLIYLFSPNPEANCSRLTLHRDGRCRK